MERTEYERLVDHLSKALDCIYGIFAVVALIEAIRLHRRDKRLSKPKVLYIVLILCCLCRISIDVIPNDYYDNKVLIHPILQMWLDLLPELFFFAVYFLLIVFWIELYFLSILKEPTVVKKCWILFFGVVGVEFLAGLLFSIGIGATAPYTDANLQKEALFLAILSIFLAGSYAAVGFYLFRKLSATQTITSLRKKNMLQQLQRLLILCVICSLAHMAYTVILEIYFKGIIVNQVARAVIWLFYFVLTEQVPTAAILIILHRVTAKVTTTKHRAQIGGRMLQPLLGEKVKEDPVAKYQSLDGPSIN